MASEIAIARNGSRAPVGRSSSTTAGYAAAYTRPSGRVSAASAARAPQAAATVGSCTRPAATARTVTVPMPTTARANRPFSRPLVVQMANDGITAVTTPATVATTTGRSLTARAAARKQRNTPTPHSQPRSLGSATRSGTPNQVPWSNSPSRCAATSRASQAGSE